VEFHRPKLEAICRKRGVKTLELFGSATRGGFDGKSSDLDFLVDFLPLAEGEHADAYFGLLEDLEQLFGRPIDLVMTRAIRNPYFAKAIQESRTTLYAA